MRVNERINSFLGLNNLLDPASAEYREGMAYACNNARISNKGLWTGEPKATTGSSLTAYACTGSGVAQRQMTLNGTTRLISDIGVATEGQNGYVYYIDSVLKKRTSTSVTATVTQEDAITPVLTSVIAGSTSSLGRIEDGVYYYIVTNYNDTIKRESLPSAAREIEFDSSTANGIAVLSDTLDAGTTRRVYRTKRINQDEGEYNAPNRFYYIGDSTTTTFTDYRSDEELTVEYEGRGTVFLNPDFIVSYNDRMLYFKNNDLWWSSSGRPEEVARKYSVVYNPATGTTGTFTLDSFPKIANGYGEAKIEISELAGETITGAIEKDGKMWIFTASMMGFLKESYSGEGYLFSIHRRGVGVINNACLQSCEHGIFGFDASGMWLLDNSNRVRRLTDNRVDLGDFTYGATNFGVWNPNLNEYWMCEGTGTPKTIVAYQADRNIFVGPYTSLTATAGCSWYSGTEAFGLMSTYKTEENTGSFTLTFYLGQSSPTTIKQRIAVEAVQTDGTKSLIVAVRAGANKTLVTAATASTTTESQTAVRSTASLTGRMIKADITVAAASALSTINYRYEPIEWSEKDGR